MKRVEIYKDDNLLLSLLVDKYEINTYTDSVEIITKICDMDITYAIVKNKGYKISVKI